MKKTINDKLLQNYNKFLVKVNSSIKKEFSSEPEESGKYLRLKIKPEKGKIKAFFHYVEIGKEDFDCICWSLILIERLKSCWKGWKLLFTNIIKWFKYRIKKNPENI